MKKLSLTIIMLLTLTTNCFADDSFQATKIPDGVIPKPNKNLRNDSDAKKQMEHEIDIFIEEGMAIKTLFEQGQAIRGEYEAVQKSAIAKLQNSGKDKSKDRAEGLAAMKAVMLYGKFEDRFTAQIKTWMAFTNKHGERLGRLADANNPTDLPIMSYYTKKVTEHKIAIKESVVLLGKYGKEMQQVISSM